MIRPSIAIALICLFVSAAVAQKPQPAAAAKPTAEKEKVVAIRAANLIDGVAARPGTTC